MDETTMSTQSHTAAAHGQSHGHESGHGDGHGVGHIVPVRTLVAVCVILLVLTWVTVAVTWVDLGLLNLWVALVIATIKAALVVLYFMHLRYDRPFNAIVFIGSLVFVMLFVGAALSDKAHYQDSMKGGEAPYFLQKKAAG